MNDIIALDRLNSGLEELQTYSEGYMVPCPKLDRVGWPAMGATVHTTYNVGVRSAISICYYRL